MSIFYHTSNDVMEKGTMLSPKYGIAIQHPQNFKDDHLYAQYLKEMIFEEVRKNHFESQPSRLKSVYLIDNLEKATYYAKKYNKKYIYSVTIESSGRLLTADMKWMDKSNKQFYDDIKEMAHKYFTGVESNNSFLELLFDGKVSVHECYSVEESKI